MKLDNHDYYLGLSSSLRWIWLDGENVLDKDNMWGPSQPDGDGRCGSFLNLIGWNSWRGYGWRWNDQSCTSQTFSHGYICEQPLGMLCEKSHVVNQALFFALSGNPLVERLYDFSRGK